MSLRVPGGGVSQSPFGPTWAGKKQEAQSVGEQMQSSLFGQKKPRVIDSDDATVARLLAEMHAFRKKLARLAGDVEDDYDLVLAESTIAMIDAEGLIYLGEQFLLEHAGNKPVRVGVLAHEIGHRPKRWAEYKTEAPRSKTEIEELCRLEETRADYFSGWALGQLGIDPEPVCAFLLAIDVHPHPTYFPAPLRVKTVKEGFEAGERRADTMQKLFPELARHMSAKHDLGTG